MPQAWDPEREVGAELARALIEEQFPALRPARPVPLGRGWDNSVFQVNGAWVFRFPRRQIAVPLLETELRLLAGLAPRLPLPVPVPEMAGVPTARFPWPFAGYRFLPGRTADQAVLAGEERAAAAPVLGRFLKVLHAMTPPRGLVRDRLGRLEAARLIAQARTRLRELSQPEPPWLDQPVRAPGANTLVHGDLHARQLLVDERGALCGVIDWGDTHLGDRASDLAVAHLFLPARARPAFLAAYGEVDPATWLLARLRALHVAAATGAYALHTGDAPLLREAHTALEFVRTS
jgi:aminoglycoside phosphotransferase (APT) family kinase protein